MRNANVEAEAEGSAKFRGGFFALELRNSPLQHLTIQIEADGFDVAVLLAAEHVAGAAQFEVERGDAEAGAKFAEFLHGGEALAGDIREGGVRGDEEVGVGALVGAADAPAELVEFGKTEAVGAIYQHGVRAGNVETIFDDGGGD